MIDFRALFRVFDWFIPVDVLSAVFLVFALENVLDHYFTLFVPDQHSGVAWLFVYFLGIAIISAMNYLTADPDEREELSEDMDDV